MVQENLRNSHSTPTQSAVKIFSDPPSERWRSDGRQVLWPATKSQGKREIFVQCILISAKRFQNMFAIAIDGNATRRNSKILQWIWMIDIAHTIRLRLSIFDKPKKTKTR